MRRDNDRDEDKSDRELLLEAVGRSRRIETRVTTLLNAADLDAGAQKPEFNEEQFRVYVRTPNTSLTDILDAIPDRCRGMYIGVYKGHQHLITLTQP